MIIRTLPLLLLLWLLPLLAIALTEEPQLLPPEEAFTVTVTPLGADRLQATWQIAEGYYLYRNKFRVDTPTAGLSLGELSLPAGQMKQDEFFGRIEIYRDQVVAEIPLLERGNSQAITLELNSQGCADIGVCYPPYTHTVSLELPLPSTLPSTPLSLFEEESEVLEPDVAFRFSHRVESGELIMASWEIAPEHYLYKDKFSFEISAEGVTLVNAAIPSGEEKQDEFFGLIEVFHHRIDIPLTLARTTTEATELTLTANYQGCAEIGICYPPLSKTVTLTLPAVAAPTAPNSTVQTTTTAVAATSPPLNEQDSLAQSLATGSAASTILLFFGLGLLLAFTPCVFPMIPILSSIIVGQGEGLSTRRAFTLSLVYVLAMALTYTVAGVLAGLFGANLQAMFQNPWILSSFSLVFVLLALSMFGFYELQLPSAVQSWLAEKSNKQQGGTLAGVAIMGLLSALIVGPCVAPPLMGALIYIGQTGDALLGGLALFALSLGMGAPLLLIGTSAGKLLPRAGGWMDAVKAVFGVLLLAVAIWMLERILPAWLVMLLWALLLISAAVYLGALEPVGDKSGWYRLWKGLGVVLLIQGILIMIGIASGAKDPLLPLKGSPMMTQQAGGALQSAHVSFKSIKSLDDLEREIASASAAGKGVMLDFYADWCISCKEMEKYTFSDPKVIAALSNTVSLQADVTANDEIDKALMAHFKIIGPPAILFFNSKGEEVRANRVVGFMEPEPFIEQISQALN
ncbi:protein-disulfide reductase DsbD [Ectothiorhodospiraceae bacterium BW-2]|nr:protein-disulfide reductase DsbD [Ectothiorhodospiraceae bacterium BW-2]